MSDECPGCGNDCDMCGERQYSQSELDAAIIAEREACARECDAMAKYYGGLTQHMTAAEECAEAIRSRDKEPAKLTDKDLLFFVYQRLLARGENDGDLMMIRLAQLIHETPGDRVSTAFPEASQTDRATTGTINTGDVIRSDDPEIDGLVISEKLER